MKKQKKDIYQEITNLFIEALEENIIPWQKPYQFKGGQEVYLPSFYDHRNGSTGKGYRSINSLILEIVKIRKKFNSSYWLTFKQASDLGLKITKGSKSTPIYYREPLYYQKVNGKRKKITAKEYTDLRRQGVKDLEFIPLFKTYRVFNIDQIEGKFIAPQSPAEPKKRNTELVGIEACEDVIKSYCELPEVKHGSPAYIPALDFITMPEMDEFISLEEYYSTFFHEIVHSTGHQTRLNRPGIAEINTADKKKYSKEELVAEIGASYLCAETGIFLPELQTNSKAYIQSWISALKNDKQMIYFAASQAQKARDFIVLENQPKKESKQANTAKAHA